MRTVWRRPAAGSQRLRVRLSEFWVGHDFQKPTAEELHDSHEHHEAEELEAADDEFTGVNELGVPKRH